MGIRMGIDNRWADVRHEGMAEKEAMGIPEPGDVPSSRVISSTRVELAGGHARLSVWNRGGLAGVLVLEGRDVDVVRGRLEGDALGGCVAAGEGKGESAARGIVHLQTTDPEKYARCGGGNSQSAATFEHEKVNCPACLALARQSAATFLEALGPDAVSKSTRGTLGELIDRVTATNRGERLEPVEQIVISNSVAHGKSYESFRACIDAALRGERVELATPAGAVVITKSVPPGTHEAINVELGARLEKIAALLAPFEDMSHDEDCPASQCEDGSCDCPADENDADPQDPSIMHDATICNCSTYPVEEAVRLIREPIKVRVAGNVGTINASVRVDPARVPCTECGGSGDGPDRVDGPGDVYQDKCSRCAGTGEEPAAESVTDLERRALPDRRDEIPMPAWVQRRIDGLADRVHVLEGQVASLQLGASRGI